MNGTTKALINLIRYEITKEPLPADISAGFSDDALKELYTLSTAHDVAHLVGSALEENNLLPNDSVVNKKFSEAVFAAAYRQEQLNYELKSICSVFENANIAFIPLKGAVLRSMYPQAWMRSGCDLDVLVKKEDLERASAELVGKLSYKQKEKEMHDVPFIAPTGLVVELHYDLIEKDINAQSELPLKDVWERSHSQTGSSHYVMDDETFYYYQVAHMAKHFVNGGCGVKAVVDVWVLNHLTGFDRQKREDLLCNGGLLDFEKAVVKLSEQWFAGAGGDDLTDYMQDYIIAGGVYGSLENMVTVQRVKRGGTFRYYMSRIFLPYKFLKFQYPILQKHKWLLPFMEVRRWFRLLFKRSSKRSSREVQINREMTEEKKKQTETMMKRLGL